MKKLCLILLLIFLVGCGKKLPKPVPNYSPVIEEFTAATDRVRIGETFTKVSFKVAVSDVNDDPLTYSWTATGGRITSPNSPETDWYAPSGANIDDEFTITIWVMDLNKDGTLRGGKVTASKTITIVADTYNRDPIIESLTANLETINSIALKDDGDLFSLENVATRQYLDITAVVRDPDGIADTGEDGENLTYSWQADGGIIADPEDSTNPPQAPTGSTARWYPYSYNPATFKYRTIAPTEYTITVTVTDPKGGSDTKSFTIPLMWGYIKSMNTGRWGLGCVATDDDKIYAIGGQNSMYNYTGLANVEEYDLANDTWSNKTPLPSPRSYFAIALVNDEIYVIGGYSQGLKVDTVEEYDITSESWSTKTPMPGGVRSGIAAGVVGGIIYVIGGFDANNNALSRVEAYNPQTDTWETKANMPTARGNLATVSWNNKIYAIGGFTSASGISATDKVEVYNPQSDSWETKPDMPTARGELAAVALNNKIYAIGGMQTSSRKSTVEEFNTLLNIWKSSNTESIPTPMPTPRNGLSAVVIGDKIYTIGGCGIDPATGAGNSPLKIVEVVMYP